MKSPKTPRVFPTNFTSADKRRYVTNLRLIRSNEAEGVSPHHVAALRAQNFDMVNGAQFKAGPLARVWQD